MNDRRDQREIEARFKSVYETFFLVIGAFLIILALWALVRVLAQ